ncbi:MAG TPA: M14 family zinc carboxypeptidase [Caldimonas sp.]|jgi:hypothetical protein|nr:M14 family zinc carboxypeptidase [Caldimonas sp.]HEX2541417.1 M14 family zinc carboxypeptidase [Caldimonas sp.]
MRIASVLAGATLALLASVATVQAQPANRPYWVTGYQELTTALQYHQARSRGFMELEVVGRSNQGRDIYLAKIGNPGNTPVMIISQQHGNEVINTESTLQLIQWLYSSPAAAPIRDRLYVLLMPRVNPDGTENYVRFNFDPSAPPNNNAVGIFTGAIPGGRGWDINRYHDVVWQNSLLFRNFGAQYPTNPVPEAVTVGNVVKRFNPIWTIDYHGQGQYLTADNRDIKASTLWPTAAAAQPAAIELSKKIVAITKQYSDQYPLALLTKYPGGPEEGISRNAYGIYGIGSVLIELKGGAAYQTEPGYLIRYATDMMRNLLLRTADGSLFTADPNVADTLPSDAPSNRRPYEEGEAGEHDHEH